MKTKIAQAAAILLAGLASSGLAQAGMDKAGIETSFRDTTVRPQDDFYRHVNGKWLKTAEIPADRSSAGAFMDLREAVVPRLHTLIENLQKKPGAAGSDAQKIGDLYASFMDTRQIEAAGLKPLHAEFAKVDAIKDKAELPALFAWLNRMSVLAPLDISVHQDNKDSTKYVLDVGQSGTALPDRDYYLKDDDAKLKGTREKYQAHIAKMLKMSGDKEAEAHAAAILALETEFARAQWTKVELRDPVKAYNKVELAKLGEVTTGFDWNAYLKALGVTGKVDYLILAQPSYLKGMSEVLAKTPLDTIKVYLKWNLLASAASQLPKEYADESFAFFAQTLRGVPQQEVRWKRGVRLVDSGMGESLGKLYVEKYFPASSKARMEELVGNLLQAYKDSVGTLDWMSDATKKEALGKLATFMPKIGYPNKWKDYSALQIKKGDALGNLRAIRQFAADAELAKLGKPVDRDEWGMTPQTVNAYYNPEMNEIVFPAAILQAPFFNPKADDAVNYGAIGAVIGHEISHGFDDQGAQYDGQGNLRDWWTKEDHEKFAAKTAALVKQYNGYSPIPGYNVNGELTLGENIADNSGLAIAYKAYKLSLKGKPAPVINGMTGEQRFFMGFAQVWRGKLREQEAIIRIKTDPHSPGEFRANGTLRNMPSFYDAFGVKPGDKLYLAPTERVSIW